MNTMTKDQELKASQLNASRRIRPLSLGVARALVQNSVRADEAEPYVYMRPVAIADNAELARCLRAQGYIVRDLVP